MQPKARFERTIGGKSRVIIVHHDAMTDGARIEVDGAPVESRVQRRPFSALWRHAFAVDGEPLEVRIRYGMVEPIIELASPTDPLAPSRLGALTYVSIVIVAIIASYRMTNASVPPAFALGLGAFAGIVTSFLVWLVYGRRSS